MAYGSQQLTAAQLRRGWLRAVGVGVLAAIAAGFMSGAVWKPAQGHAIVQALLEFQAGDRQRTLELEKVRDELLAPNALRPALEAAGQASDPLTVTQWQRAISVHRAAPAAALVNPQIAVEASGPDEAATIAVLNHLTQSFLRQRQKDGSLAVHASPELGAARRELSARLAREDEARRTLDALVKQQFDRLRRAEQSSATPQEHANASPVANSKAQTNPAWQKVADDIATLEAKREKLLLTLTTEHPTVKDVEGELEELQSRQMALPRYLESPGEEQEPSLAPRSPAMSEPLLAAAAAMAADQEKVRAALATYEAAKARRLEEQAAVEVLERSTAEAPQSAPKYRLVQSAQAIGHQPAAFQIVRSLTIAFASLLMLIAVTLACRPRVRREQLATVDDITRLLRMPVIAQLRLGNSRMH